MWDERKDGCQGDGNTGEVDEECVLGSLHVLAGKALCINSRYCGAGHVKTYRPVRVHVEIDREREKK